jgi:hypothetical protein
MQRKHFLGTIATLFSGSLLPAEAAIPEPFGCGAKDPAAALPEAGRRYRYQLTRGHHHGGGAEAGHRTNKGLGL